MRLMRCLASEAQHAMKHGRQGTARSGQIPATGKGLTSWIPTVWEGRSSCCTCKAVNFLALLFAAVLYLRRTGQEEDMLRVEGVYA